MPPDTPHPHDCPATGELDRLIVGRLGEARAKAVTAHLDRCPECQLRMESLAAGGDPLLTTTVRQCVADRPPPDSAFWPALSAAAAEVSATALMPPPSAATPRSGNRTGEYKLSFLRPTTTRGRIGMLGTFDVIAEIGRGGMGVVLRAHDPCLEREVAVKVLDPQLADNEVARQRFCREARAAAKLTHENLVAVHTVDEDAESGLPYFVMQLVTGESLEQRIRRAGKMSAAEVARLGQQAAAGLAAAHKEGLIHRDIKPGNILLEAGTDRVKLTDFGLARAAEDVKLTRTGFVAGTPLYMAPEQARGDTVDARSDLFSLGSVLYEAATGVAPFDGKTPLVVLNRVTDDTQPPLRAVTPDVPHWLSDVVDRLLEKRPADRFQTAQEVADIFTTELSRLQAGQPSEQSGVCGGSVYARRRHICMKSVGRVVLPWVGGAVAGVLAAALLVPPRTVEVAVPTPTPPATAAEPDPGPEPKHTIAGKAGPVWSVSYTPDGSAIVVGSENGMVRFIDTAKWTFNRNFSRGSGTVWAVDAAGDGKSVAVVTDDAMVRVYDLATGEFRVFPHPTSARTAAFNADGSKLATGDRNSTLRVWDTQTQVPIELVGHTGTIHGVAFSPDGGKLVSSGSDGAVKLWTLAKYRVGGPNAELPVKLDLHEGPVYAVAYSPDASVPRVASGGWDQTVRVWNATSGGQEQVLRHAGDVWSLNFSRDGKLLASASQDGTVKVWDVATGAERQSFRAGGRPLHSVRFAPDGRTLAAAGRDGTVRVWEVK
ncbi:WD40 repeat domain-containing serine/threonine protein kinase [Urbifossiella limnaea]|uniref:non-specific serine/threonine protein kinase n=1 Tax=Urbifossiella limnaea TaxID=2528023 RepID=A0A517XMW0_9BACT|nr:serine/threonine-protein kinase [Urbifossiella limnaea]QDU18841.1 Serine/threonine-protein kinase PknB [Urbifossiella limnaea]